MAEKGLRLRITGIVQGVGFRPFIYRVAVSSGVKGYVVNLGGSEVEVYVEGDNNALVRFLTKFVTEKPPPCRLESIELEATKLQGFREFIIRRSEKRLSKRSMIPPDFGICEDCIREILDPSSRFYRYPWNSCAWCGPRFSMMVTVPYDRENTTMQDFPLCPDCTREYKDPSSIRRFHAQGISCPKCGPRTFVYDSKGRLIDVDDPVGFIVDAIERGHIVAIKGVGGYHIAALATSDDVVRELRRRKRRPRQPFALMARDYSVVEEITIPPPGARLLLESPEKPIVILPKRPGSRVSEEVAPGLSTLGVMLPYTGFQVMLLRGLRDGFLIMTSGNIHGRPMCTSLDCVLRELKDVVDYIVEHERRIVHRVDDSVIRFTDGKPVFLRRARGYAPLWLKSPIPLPDSIAVGAELQVAGAVGFEDKLVPTQFIGDLDEPGQLDDLQRELEWFIQVYKLRPRNVVLDMHPLYHNRDLALELAEKYNAELLEVQHHHAHAAAAMAEYGVGLDWKGIAITIDGTGYGVDGGIWGGEVLETSYTDFQRVGSLYPFYLPGGDTAAKYPVKPLIALLAQTGYDEDEVEALLEKLGLIEALPHGLLEVRVTYKLAKSRRAIVTTSMGRTLDAFSALLRISLERTYEGEPAIMLEARADYGKDLGYTPPLAHVDGRLVVDTRALLEWVLENLDKRVEDLARTILAGLGRALGELAARYLERLEGPIFVSGGAAVNTYIVQGIKQALAEHDATVVIPRKLPPGDGGIAVGQLVVAAAKTSS